MDSIVYIDFGPDAAMTALVRSMIRDGDSDPLGALPFPFRVYRKTEYRPGHQGRI